MRKWVSSTIGFMCAAILPLCALADCAYLDNNTLVFDQMYTRLVNRGPNMLAGYGIVTNNDNVDHILTGVSTPNAKQSNFMVYRQENGAGDITAHPIDSITVPMEGGVYVWQMGGNFIALTEFNQKTADQKLTFGTTFDPNQTIPITFMFSDGCTKTIENVPIRDRMND